jgi:nicotinate dehydrogenase subunit B
MPYMSYLAEPPTGEEKPGRGFGLTRRELLQALGGGLLVLALAPLASAQRESGRRGGGGQVPQTVAAWLHIGPDGKVRVFTGKVEVGQNARTSLAQAVAEELRLSFEAVEMVMGDTDLCPFDMGTFGSRTTPQMAPQLRRAAATAREALLDAAAKKWSVAKSSLRCEDGYVRNGAATLSFGELAQSLPAELAIAESAALTPSAEWKTLGTDAPKTNIRKIVTGTHAYTIDLRRPGMLHAKVLRPPSLGAKLLSADASEAEKMPGVRVVREEGFVAVAAPTARLADKALLTIEARWEETAKDSHKELFPKLRGGGEPLASAGLALTEDGAIVLHATYTCPYIAHVPLEPRAALAEWDGKKMTVHTGTQRPFGVRGEVAQGLGLPESQVRVIVPDTGSGYGGKHTGDAAVEAAKVAKALGVPIKLVWSRWEEFMFAYFRPAGVVELAAEAGSDGLLKSWTFTNHNSGGSGLRTPYEVATKEENFRQAQSPLRQGSYRALAATFNHFARESAMDELASASQADPLAFRLKNLKNERLSAVLQAAAKRFGWGEAKAAEGRGFGLACGVEKGACVASVVEVQASKDTGQIRVLRCVTAFECGAVVNPRHCENQVMGSVLQGFGGALFEAIEFENGKILNGFMARYRVPKYSDMPAIEVVLVDRKDLPSAGAGETAIVAIAPAVANAIFAATGERLRNLPLKFGS